MKKSVVIGYGSIGSRHARILRELGCPVAVVSGHNVDFKPSYVRLKKALRQELPEYVIIANKTVDHYTTLLELQKYNFRGILLVEKPLFSTTEKFTPHTFKKTLVAYNLRFHPLLGHLKELLKKERSISVQCYVGQYLPNWHPQANYRRSYSASKKLGGGALRDLSHELDYLGWMFGPCKRLTALGGHLSSLHINSDDVFSLLMVMQKCPLLTVQMNYLDRVGRREIVVNTDRHTYRADLIRGTLYTDKAVEDFAVSSDFTYLRQHESILRGDFKNTCSYEEGYETVRLIENAEKAARDEKWVSR